MRGLFNMACTDIYDIMWLKRINNPCKNEKHLIKKNKLLVKSNYGQNKNQHTQGDPWTEVQNY
uniref:Uncharacterized protein n=1 Tax=Anguilla anguilla TaxID=7936 RepID=A0A0E9XXS3_ANGAN